jgi:diguanylate cyclase (GGDEF)-like protein
MGSAETILENETRCEGFRYRLQPEYRRGVLLSLEERVMMSIAAFFALFRVETGKPGLMQAQVKALSGQIPLLFFITVVNTVALASTYYGVAPNSMTIGFSIFITIGYVWRGRDWWKMGRRPISDLDAGRLLKLTVILGPACSAIITAWALALYHYGDAYAQGHIVFYMGVTLVSCTFCMMPLRPAALLMTAVTVIPFSIFLLATGQPAFVAIVLSMILVAAAMIYILLVSSRDFASLVESQRENLRLANTDSLTELSSRRRFLAVLDEAVERATRDDQRFVVGFVDLDGFKAINDLYGRAAGDKVLVEAGQRMRRVCDETILLSRLGADRFGVIVEKEMIEADMQALGDCICKALAGPFMLPGMVVEVSGSVGLAAFPQAGSTAELLRDRADYALYHAKQDRRGCALIFSFEHEAKIRQLADLEQCLRRADLETEMSLYFQPIVDVQRGKVVAFEALARWVSPILGRVAPDVFIRIAERSDLINKLTTTLLRRSLVEAKNWPDDIRVSFNLSMRDLGSREAIVNIVAIIENSGIAPSRIDLEVTETALIEDYDEANVSLRTLKALGVDISLDDFGTGYSSLSYVRRFPIDKLKIDRSFVREIETDGSCRAMVKSVIDMSRNLKLGCIVEGIETDNQVSILRSLGGTMMQGYLFSKPMPAAAVLDFLDATRSSWNLLNSTVCALAS